jgi:hypothetical protein
MKGVAPSTDTELIEGIKSFLIDFDSEQSEQRSSILTSERPLQRVLTSVTADEPKKDSDLYSRSDDSSLSSSSSDDSSVSSQHERLYSNMLKTKKSGGGRSTSTAKSGDSCLSSESDSVSSSSDE